jgi:bifunctional NMN adenylyltransferase/nudix hydrolase
MNKPSFGVIVGRFQVHELHDGHMELFRIVRGRHQRVIVFLGCTKVGPTRHDPLDFETRKKMVQAKFPEFTVLPLKDKKTDEIWSAELDERISDAVGEVPADVTLYGSRDSFAPFYHGKHKVKELEIEVPASLTATDIREKLTNHVMESPDFRAGVIYAMNQLWPRLVTVVDVAVLHKAWKGLMVLLGKKSDDTLWRFPGGHAVFTTPSFEEDAKKEVFEETGLDVCDLEYVGSRKVDSWRWKAEPSEGYKTIFFVAYSMTVGGRGADDLAETRWFPLDEVTVDDIEKEHKPLFEMLKQHVSVKNSGTPPTMKESPHAETA